MSFFTQYVVHDFDRMQRECEGGIVRRPAVNSGFPQLRLS
jgi:hypothetical protein